MKKLILLTAAFLTLNFVFAQGKSVFSLSFGPSIPLGEFGSKDIDNQYAGFAKTGLMVEFSYNQKLGKYFGITFINRSQSHFMDAQALSDAYAQLFPGLGNSVESAYWSNSTLMLGASSSIPITKTISFESRLMFGFATAKSPDMFVHFGNNVNKAWVHQNDVTSFALTSLIGAGFKFDVTKSFSLLLNVDVQGLKPEFRDVVATNSDGLYMKDTYSQKMNTLNIGFGLGYRF